MKLALMEHLHPRFRSKMASEPAFRNIIGAIEGATPEEWFELRGELKLACRLKKPGVEAVITRIRPVIAAIEDSKLRDACLQLAGQYVAIIVRSELNGRNSGAKNRASELFSRAEVFVYPPEPGKPRRPRGAFRKARLAHELDVGFFAALASSNAPPEAALFNSELVGEQ